jgi:hypothetical protein
MIDGGLRLTLDLGDVDPAVIVALFEAKQPGVILEVAAVAVNVVKQEESRNDVQKGTKRKSEWQTAEVPRTNGDT